MNSIDSKPADSNSMPSHSATLHWLMQRGTALVLIPLSVQFIVFLGLCFSSPYQDVLAWLQKPLNLYGLGAWIAVVFYHTALGLQVVVEDYIGGAALQTLLIKIIHYGCLVMALIALVLLFIIG